MLTWMHEPSATAPRIEPLTCPACGGPVPLADKDEVRCPYCGAAVPIPEEHRALRRELATLTSERRTAEGLYRRLGEPPSRVLRLFLVFESPWFWLFGAGFWIVFCVTAFTFAVPFVAAHLLRINANDVLTAQQLDMINIGGTLGTIVLGLLLAAWNHKRVVSLGGLQAALAAAPPSSPGGPARCRTCGAALGVAPGALGARCDYCHADNLVQIPPDWVRRASQLARSVARATDDAVRAEREARSKLRWSLFWRLVLGGGPVALLMVGFASASSNGQGELDVDSSVMGSPYSAPDKLPVWSKDHVPTWKCATWNGSPMQLDRCAGGRCETAFIVALRAKRAYRTYVHGAPAGAEVWLDDRHEGFFEASWTNVAHAALGDGVATLSPPLKGWYRVRVRGGSAPTSISVCSAQE